MPIPPLLTHPPTGQDPPSLGSTAGTFNTSHTWRIKSHLLPVRPSDRSHLPVPHQGLPPSNPAPGFRRPPHSCPSITLAPTAGCPLARLPSGTPVLPTWVTLQVTGSGSHHKTSSFLTGRYTLASFSHNFNMALKPDHLGPNSGPLINWLLTAGKMLNFSESICL